MPQPMRMEESKILNQAIAGVAAAMSMLCGGYHFGWSSPSLPKLLAKDSDIPITSDESSWIVSFFTFGSLFGSLIGAVLVDRYGRKFSLLSTVIPFLTSCVLFGVAQSYWWFLAARFIAGLGTGMSYGIAPMYLGEIANDKIRGALGTLMSVLLNLGILLSYCVGPWMDRVAFAIFGGAMPLIFGLTFIWMPESPHFLIMKERVDEAEKSLLWLKGSKSVSEELKKVKRNVELDQKNAGTVKELVMIPGNRKALIIILGLTAAQQFSGVSAILSYTSLIFETTGSTLDTNLSVIIIGTVQLLSGGLSTFTVDLAGRRILLLLSACGVVVFLGGEAVYFQLQSMGTDVSAISWLPVTAIVGFIIFYALGLGCLLHVVLSEIFPVNVKALASMASTIAAALCGMGVAKLYQIVADAYGIHVSLWGFAAFTILSIIFIYFMLPETKRRSLRSIQDEFHKTTESTVALEKSNEA